MISTVTSLPLLLSAPAGAPAPDMLRTLVKEPAPIVREMQVDENVSRILELTNNIRAKNGLRPLRLQQNLCEAAGWMARDMAQKSYFDHRDSMGRRCGKRADFFGYVAWRNIGENLAAGQTTPESAMNAWMNSMGHRSNILNPKFTEIGISYSENDDSAYGQYWVQAFGSR